AVPSRRRRERQPDRLRGRARAQGASAPARGRDSLVAPAHGDDPADAGDREQNPPERLAATASHRHARAEEEERARDGGGRAGELHQAERRLVPDRESESEHGRNRPPPVGRRTIARAHAYPLPAFLVTALNASTWPFPYHEL